jgi:hypothetical protein
MTCPCCSVASYLTLAQPGQSRHCFSVPWWPLVNERNLKNDNENSRCRNCDKIRSRATG